MRDAVKIVLKQNIDGLTTQCILQYSCFPCALNRGFFLTCSLVHVTLGMLLYAGVLTNALKKNLAGCHQGNPGPGEILSLFSATEIMETASKFNNSQNLNTV